MDDITAQQFAPTVSAPATSTPVISAAIDAQSSSAPKVAAMATSPEDHDRPVRHATTCMPANLGRDIAVGIGNVPARGHRSVDGGGDWTSTAVSGGVRTLVIGDMAGHGPDLAAHARAARTTLANRIRRHDSPAAALTGLDHDWHHTPVEAVLSNLPATPKTTSTTTSTSTPVMITACVMTATPLRLPSDPHDPYGPSDGQPATWWRLRWSNAGHPHPLLITPTGIVTTLTCGPNDLPIGVDPTRARTDHTTTVPDGCTLLLFTDGLTEHRRHTTGHQQLTRLANQFAVKLQSEQLTEHLGRVTARRTYYPHPATLVQRILTALEPLLDADEATLLAARLHTRAAASPAPPPRRAGKPAEIHGPTSGGPTAITSTRYHLRAA